MKKVIFVFAIIIWTTTLLSQNTFEFVIQSENNDIATDIIQMKDSNYLFTGYIENKTRNLANGIIYILNQNGNTISYINIPKVDSSIFLYHIDTIGGLFFSTGVLISNDSSNQKPNTYIIFFNEYLELLSEIIIPIPSEYNNITSQYVYRRNHMFTISGDINHINFTEYSHDLYIYEINLLNNSIRGNFLQKENIQLAQGLLSFPNNQGHYIFSVGAWGFPPSYSTGYFTEVDSNLNFLQTDSLPGDIHSNNFSLYRGDEKYLLSGRERVPIGFQGNYQHRSVLYEMQYPNVPIKCYNFHMGLDTTSFPGYKSFDLCHNSFIYFSGTANVIPQEFPYQDDPSWIFLSKLDQDLNPIWTKLYGGNMFYQIYSIKATLDGGAIMACRTYDYLTQDHEHDILIIKVDEDGLIVGTEEEPSGLTAQDAIVYPNPGSEFLKVQSGPQINGALFELFDLSGNLVLSTTLDERMETIDTNALQPGTYPYRVTYQKKIVANGKWVKH